MTLARPLFDRNPMETALTLNHFLLVSGVLFAIGLAGVLVRRNLIIIFMCLELMLAAANLTISPVTDPAQRPDGSLYDTIVHGKGLMGGYKHNLPVRDRWAIVAYLRALQASAK